MKALGLVLPLVGLVGVLELVRVRALVQAWVLGSVVALVTVLVWVLALAKAVA